MSSKELTFGSRRSPVAGPAAQIRQPAEIRWAVYGVKADSNSYKRA
jgi:hypothetical protein